MVKTIVKTQTEIIWDNREYILNRVSSGVDKGASIREMFRVISREIGVSPSSLSVAWYGQRKHGILPLRESTSPSAITIKSKKPKKTHIKKKVTVANSILKEVKMLTDLLSQATLAQQEANMTLLEKISKVENENKMLVNVVSKQIKALQTPVAATNNIAISDGNGNLSIAQPKSQYVFNEDKVIELMNISDELEQDVKEKEVMITELKHKISTLVEENDKLKGRTVFQRVMNIV